MTLVIVLSRVLLALIFALSGAAKLADLAGSRKAIADFGVPAWLAPPTGSLLPAVELAVAALLLPAPTAWWAGVAALVLLSTFSAAIGLNLLFGRKPECRCFGQVHSTPIGWPTLTRNAVLIACAGLIVWPGRSLQVSFASWFTALTPSQAFLSVTAVLLLGFALQTWLIFHVFRQHGRLLLRMDELESRFNSLGMAAVPAPPAGLPIGAPAPPFELSSVNGGTLSLDALREGGEPLLLIFAGPDCAACTALMPDIARWQAEYAGKLRIAVVSEGAEKANRAQVKRHAIKDLILQQDREVAEAYQVNGTPSAVVIRPDGSIGGRVMMGSQAIADLVRRTTGDVQPSTATHDRNGHLPHQLSPAGLPIGETAPVVSLPDLAGHTVTLSDLRGRKMLLLFWSMSCGFCQRMLPDLLEWEDNRPTSAPELVLISAGSAEANRKMGLRSSVLLDQAGAVARQFRGGATPAAVLIDAEGRIASELALGAPSVLALAGMTRVKAVKAAPSGVGR